MGKDDQLQTAPGPFSIGSGHFNLFPLLAFVATEKHLPHFGGKDEKVKTTEYAMAVDRLLNDASVPRSGGWYLWGRFNDAAWWEPIYIGMTTKGKTADLRTRLRDELREESQAIFAAVYGRDAVMSAAREQYAQHVKKGYTDYFRKGEGVQRSLRKTEARFVIWVATDLKDQGIDDIEDRLIHLYRPAFNARRRKIRQEELFAKPLLGPVCEAIESEIAAMRGDFKI
jgi:hypothetical protein